MFPSQPKAPPSLASLQHWFAQVITTPLEEGEHLPSLRLLETKANHYIVPTTTRTSYQRMEVYAQQYWRRLLHTLEEIFPFLFRLVGPDVFFEEIAVPYLTRFTPNHWSLHVVGSQLPQFIQETYPQNTLWSQAALLDLEYHNLFIDKEFPSLQEKMTLEELFQQETLVLSLQPCVRLYRFDVHLPLYRDQVLSLEQESVDKGLFPSLEKEGPYFCVLFRGREKKIFWCLIDPLEFALLQKLEETQSLTEALNSFARDVGDGVDSLGQQISLWCAKWIQYNWVTSC